MRTLLIFILFASLLLFAFSDSPKEAISTKATVETAHQFSLAELQYPYAIVLDKEALSEEGQTASSWSADAIGYSSAVLMALSILGLSYWQFGGKVLSL